MWLCVVGCACACLVPCALYAMRNRDGQTRTLRSLILEPEKRANQYASLGDGVPRVVSSFPTRLNTKQ